MKHRYISLLEKFEVSLRINPNQMIIPSLMPESMSYPKPDETLSDIPSSMLDDVERYYQPPLHRFWVADYIPDGFWPRLICRVATDHQIKKVSVFTVECLYSGHLEKDLIRGVASFLGGKSYHCSHTSYYLGHITSVPSSEVSSFQVVG